MTYRKEASSNPFNVVSSLLIGVFILIGLYYLVSWVLKMLYIISPAFLVVALIIDYKVVLNYGKWVYNLIMKNATTGIIVALLSAVGYPFLFGFLMIKALFFRKVRKIRSQYETKAQGEYVEYEELEEEPPVRVELPRVDKRSKKDENYDQFFD